VRAAAALGGASDQFFDVDHRRFHAEQQT